MAQLKQDEWPKDNEPTTSEEENASFKREGENPPGKKTGHSRDDMQRGAYAPVVDTITPDQQVD